MKTDQEFIKKHFVKIKELLIANGVATETSKVHFSAWSTLFYLNPSSASEIGWDKLKTSLMKLANEDLVLYTIRLSGVKSFGTDIVQKGSVPFESLDVTPKPTTLAAENNISVNGSSKDEAGSATLSSSVFSAVSATEKSDQLAQKLPEPTTLAAENNTSANGVVVRMKRGPV